MKTWLIALGENNSQLASSIENNNIGIGWSNVGDLHNYKSKNEIMAVLNENKNETNNSLTLWNFYHEMQISDVVYCRIAL